MGTRGRAQPIGGGRSPVDQVDVGRQVVLVEMCKELREVLFEEHLECSKVRQHLRREGRRGLERAQNQIDQ